LEGLGLERIILKWILEKWDGEGGVDKIGMAEDRESFRVLVNAVMNIELP
jgi:hypothetical protein